MNVKLIAHVSVIVATFIVATTFPIGQYIAPHMDASAIVFFRFVISLIVMVPIALLTNLVSLPSLKRFSEMSAIGFTHAGFFVCMFIALRDTDSLNTSVMYTLVPSISAIVAFLIIGEKINSIHSVLLPVGIIATLWVIFEGSIEELMRFSLNSGDLIFLVGCFCLGIYSSLLKKFHVKGRTLDIVFWAMFSGAVPLGIFFLLTESNINYSSIPADVYGWIIYLAVLTVLTSFVWAYGTPKIGPMKTMAYSYLIPSFVVGINGVVYDVWPDVIIIPGFLVGLVCMIFIQMNYVSRVDPVSEITNKRKTNA